MALQNRIRIVGLSALAILGLQAGLVIWFSVGQPVHLELLSSIASTFSGAFAHLEQARWGAFLVILGRILLAGR